MQKTSEPKLLETRHPRKIGLLGAPLDTGNMGVSALAEAAVKIILNHWPDAEVVLVRGGDIPGEHNLSIMGKEVLIRTIPIRFSKNIFLPYHFLVYLLYSLLVKVMPKSSGKNSLLTRNPYFRTINEIDVIADITAGDSLSDIYGFKRFFCDFLCKWIFIFLGKELVLLPQTYGPFKRPLTRVMVRYIMNHASLVYSRDLAGFELAKNLLKNPSDKEKVRFTPDIAFVLDPRRPVNNQIDSLERIKQSNNKILVGLNVSGLLLNGGYTRDNAFRLKVDYFKLIRMIIERFAKYENVSILLVPHVFPPAPGIESDVNACAAVYESLEKEHKDRIILLQGKYDQSEIKYVIGLCDFMIGSRMHACIAALSQNIPAAGIAYSKKFHGVFESIGVADCVADARDFDEITIIEKVVAIFEDREQIREGLKQKMPQIKREILNIFNNCNSEY
jgi:polysaccharide pyruvyl transferase WcaK-like protein